MLYKGTFRFYKTADNRWYIDLPDWGGALADLEMVEGADTMLDKVSGYSNECFLEMSSEPLQGADQLKLVNDLRNSIGGGEYLMERYKGETVNHIMWLCEVTETVFGELPQMIYVNYPD